jgi:periplasmic copper chaperone A
MLSLHQSDSFSQAVLQGLGRAARRLVVLAPLVLAAAPVLAQVQVNEPWVRATVAQQSATGAFMKIGSTEALRLVAARSPAARTVEIHEMAMVGDLMKMRAVTGIDLPAGGSVELKPGGYHVMLIDVTAPIAAGATVPITLVFEDAKQQRREVAVQATARALGAGAAGMPGHKGHGQQATMGQ